MRFLGDTDLLKIEDILPFFPDFVVIDDFKEEIAHALEGYSAHIDDLKREMDDVTRTAESIKQDIVELKNRFVTIDAGERCSTCAQLLLTRQSYIFPCQHTFHADCLIGLVRLWIIVQYFHLTCVLSGERVLACACPQTDSHSADRTCQGCSEDRPRGPPNLERCAAGNAAAHTTLGKLC